VIERRAQIGQEDRLIRGAADRQHIAEVGIFLITDGAFALLEDAADEPSHDRALRSGSLLVIPAKAGIGFDVIPAKAGIQFLALIPSFEQQLSLALRASELLARQSFRTAALRGLLFLLVQEKVTKRTRPSALRPARILRFGSASAAGLR